MNDNTADTYARMAIADSIIIMEARDFARRARTHGRSNLATAGYKTSAKRAALVRGYADLLIRNREVTP